MSATRLDRDTAPGPTCRLWSGPGGNGDDGGRTLTDARRLLSLRPGPLALRCCAGPGDGLRLHGLPPVRRALDLWGTKERTLRAERPSGPLPIVRTLTATNNAAGGEQPMLGQPVVAEPSPTCAAPAMSPDALPSRRQGLA